MIIKKLKNFFSSKQLNDFYISVSIRQFALGLIEIFIPIYLLNFGFSLKQVVILFLVQSLIHIFYVPIVAKFASKIGFKKSILIGIPFTLYSFYLLFTLKIDMTSLLIFGAFKEIGSTMFYMSYHVLFAKYTQTKKRGKELGFLDMLTSSLGILSPFIGGFLLTTYEIYITLIFVGILLFISIAPLLFSKDYTSNLKINLRKIFKFKNKKYFIAFFGHGIENMMDFLIWPIFIFFYIIESYIFLGFMFTVISVVSIIFTFFIGKYTDKNKTLMLKIGSLTSSLIWIIKYFISTPLGVITLNSVKGISEKITYIPFNTISYELANKINLISFLLYREIMIHLGRIFLYLILLFFIIDNDIRLSFIFGIIANLTYFFLV